MTSSFSYTKSINISRMYRKQRRQYRIANYKRFICSNLILWSLVIFLITSIVRFKEQKVLGQESDVLFKPLITNNSKSFSNLETKNIVPLDNLYQVKRTSGIYISKEEIERSIENHADKAETKIEPVFDLNTKLFISEEERRLLAQLVEAEAGGESLIGKIAVVNVVLNRVNDKDFPNTITEVIMQKGQFTPVATGRINNSPSEESMLAVKKAIDEGYRVFGPNIVYFCNKKIATNRWMIENKKEAITIGSHTFYYK